MRRQITCIHVYVTPWDEEIMDACTKEHVRPICVAHKRTWCAATDFMKTKFIVD
jgi:hypothetical protein